MPELITIATTHHGLFPQSPMRLLFSSIPCYLDPASGAALSTRELLELLAARGRDCRVLTAGILDPKRETPLDEVLATLELPAGRFQAQLGTGRVAEVVDLGVNGVRVTVMSAVFCRAERLSDSRGPWAMARHGRRRENSASQRSWCLADSRGRAALLGSARASCYPLINRGNATVCLE